MRARASHAFPHPIPGTLCHSCGVYITTVCINACFLHIGGFSSGHGFPPVFSAPWHAGSPPEHQGASVGPGRGPWHVLWGSKSQVTTGRHSEHVEPSRPRTTHAQVKECPTAHAISKLKYLANILKPRDQRRGVVWSDVVQRAKGDQRTQYK